MHSVAVLLFDGVVAFDAAVPLQVFGHPDERDVYRVRTCSPTSDPVEASPSLTLEGDLSLALLRRADTIVVPGIDEPLRPVPPALLAALRRAHSRGARMVSICTGAFVLAAAGVLDGHRATTHWRDADLLASMHPEIAVDPDALYVDEGRVLTSAGVAAGIDLCIHIVRKDHGSERANRVARRMVVAPHRDGGQAQFVERPVPARGDGGLAATRAWMKENLERPLTVAEMAGEAAMSDRSFARHFHAETGQTPLSWLNQQRLLRAQHLLEETNRSVDQIASECGFGTGTTMRVHFQRRLRTTPNAYRRAFQAGLVSADAHPPRPNGHPKASKDTNNA